MRKDFIFAALLGYSHEQFLGSQEYEAFRDGFDMYLTSSIPSLAQVRHIFTVIFLLINFDFLDSASEL